MNFFLITGPPAVGKMTIGQALRDRLGYKLLHNHQSLELGLELFDWGDKELSLISNGIRQLVFKTVSGSSSLKGFIFTLVWGFELQEDWDYVNSFKDQFEDKGWKFHIVELIAAQSTRLERNNTPNRLKHKPSKRDISYSSSNIIKMDEKHRMTSNPGEFDSYSYLRIDNNALEPDQVVDRIISYFELN